MRPLAALARDRRGGTALEFSIVCPVLLMLMMGLGELCYEAYVRAVLNGAVEKAGRDSGIQGGDAQAATIDGKVITAVRAVAKAATYTSSRKNYDQFGYIAPEPFTDTNKNGVRDAGECFTDINNNTTWDADPGITGQGGASDVTVYTITIVYPRLFPIGKMLGWSANQTIAATVTLKNQPYAAQSTNATPTVCT